MTHLRATSAHERPPALVPYPDAFTVRSREDGGVVSGDGSRMNLLMVREVGGQQLVESCQVRQEDPHAPSKAWKKCRQDPSQGFIGIKGGGLFVDPKALP